MGVALMAASAAAAFAQTPDYFPLQPGNQWIYQSSSRWFAGEMMVVSVERQEEIDGRLYSLVRGFPDGDAWLRMTGAGELYALDRETGQERPWAEFATPEGGTYRTAINECNSQARVVSRAAEVRTPAATFGNALHVEYPAANCADAGLTEDFFVPYIGLVKRSFLTIAGPHSLELMYSRTGVTVLSQPELSFSLSIDRVLYENRADAAQMAGWITLRNTADEDLPTLQFPTLQKFDVEIRNGEGTVVRRWSDSLVFPPAVDRERIYGERNWVFRMPLSSLDGRLLATGRYVAEAWLTTGGERRWRASVEFGVIAIGE